MSNQANPSHTTPTSQTGRSSMTSGGHGGQAIPHDRIATRAYEKWCQRGCPQGTHQQDWYEAEAELRSEMTGQGMGRTGQASPSMQQPGASRPGQAGSSGS